MALSLVSQSPTNAANEVEGLLTADEVANLLKVSRGRAYELMRGQHFAVVRIGRQVRVSARSLQEFVRSGGSPISAK